jgi:hypothetical protein
LEAGAGSCYSGRERAEVTDRSTMSTVLQRRRGVGEVLGRCYVIWRSL